MRTLATYALSASSRLTILQGSVLDFAPRDPAKAAIVNAANTGCLGGGGVDGAISEAGGRNLARDRIALPEKDGVRCPVGSAVRTGPGNYGRLPTDYVLHAVGPMYQYDERLFDKQDRELISAYQETMALAVESRLDQVAFSLLSAGVYRGPRSLYEVLLLGILALRDSPHTVPDVYLCGFTGEECTTLCKVCDRLGLQEYQQ